MAFPIKADAGAGADTIDGISYERDSQPPHLIQTVTPQDIYEGMSALGFLENPVLEEEDCESTFKNVKGCIVRIRMGDAYGSGVIWEMTPERIVIATNGHVLEYWENRESCVDFSRDMSAQAEILGISDVYDVGFLAVDNRQFAYEELERLRYVPKDMEAYGRHQSGDEIFWVGAESENDTEFAEHFYPGSIGGMWLYLEDFGAYMMYGYGYAKAGMSGGGMFDAKGNFIGMLSGASKDGMTAGVPLPVIIEAWEELL